MANLALRMGLGVGAGSIFLDGHVFELAGFEDLTALKTLDEFGIFIASDDLNARMLTRFVHGISLGCVRGL